jgi:hypothetical protein
MPEGKERKGAMPQKDTVAELGTSSHNRLRGREGPHDTQIHRHY